MAQHVSQSTEKLAALWLKVRCADGAGDLKAQTNNIAADTQTRRLWLRDASCTCWGWREKNLIATLVAQARVQQQRRQPLLRTRAFTVAACDGCPSQRQVVLNHFRGGWNFNNRINSNVDDGYVTLSRSCLSVAS